MKYSQHPLSVAFPAMVDEEYSALVEDIRKHGQRDVATLADGMVIDGWHRYRACEELRIPCRFEEYIGQDAVAFVRSKNQHRRHYQKSQQAAIEVSLTGWADSHRPNKGAPGAPLSTNEEMAKRAGTGERTIKQAKRAHEAGLGDAVRDGKLSAKQAAEIAKYPELAKQVAHGETSLPKALAQAEGKSAKAKSPKFSIVSENAPSSEEQAEILAEMEQDGIEALIAENESLRNQIAAQLFTGSAEEKAAFLDRLNALSAENRNLTIYNNGLIAARDRVMAENVSLKRQCEINQRTIKKLQVAA